MRRITNPLRLIIIGGVLVLLGFGLSFALVLELLESSFLLSFLAYALSVVGLFCGVVGAIQYQQSDRW